VGGNLISDPAFIRRKLWFSSKASIPKRIYSDLLARIWSSISCSHLFPPIWKVHFPWKKLKLLFFYCDGNKTPGPDGMIFLFLKEAWSRTFTTQVACLRVLTGPFSQSFLKLWAQLRCRSSGLSV
jgi:hypothetical protein